MSPRAANRNWGNSTGYAAMNEATKFKLTEFEKLSLNLGLYTEEAQLRSKALKDFARKHGRHRYVPENLLKAWGLYDDFSFGSDL